MTQKNGSQEQEQAKPVGAIKALVHYKELVMCMLGRSALVVPCDHPSSAVSNTGLIATSQVIVELDQDGCFETLNTRYAPIPKMKV